MRRAHTYICSCGASVARPGLDICESRILTLLTLARRTFLSLVDLTFQDL